MLIWIKTRPVRSTVLLGVAVVLLAALAFAGGAPARRAGGYERRIRPHFDHAPVIAGPFATPQEVTRRCLTCHPGAAEVATTPHFTWLGEPVEVPGHAGKVRLGKRNAINNFCITIGGNEPACTKCHAGYGWTDARYDFTRVENVDCLVCHERGSGYVKGRGGLPEGTVDLVAAARSVGTPGRENCLACHAYGGGGQAVKHGDLDSSLEHPVAGDDVHMGRHGFQCVDCHGGAHHRIRGRAFSVRVAGADGVACADCHRGRQHQDERIEAHLPSLACQTCHIPRFARRIPTKATWDWSKAGDAGRAEDPHHYLRIKGEFTYQTDAVPEYRWFDGSVDRYLVGDRMDPGRVTPLNPPRGGAGDPAARIWPFKIHRGLQPYDVVNRILLTPVTGGAGGYWTHFDWGRALALGAEASGLPYSGQHGFARTEMYWPLSHMVVPGEQALGCADCHGAAGRMDWKALGYAGDPMQVGGRR